VGAVAFKFQPISRETIALARVDQVGGTGRITPVAEFKPIRILGAEISRASLYNQSYVEQIGFGVGARIMVSRANDVIPRVVSVSGQAEEVSQAPETCPECGAKTERDGEYVVCPNTGGCPAQTEGRIKAWIREQGIMEWGPTLIGKVVTECGVKTVPDLYRLTAFDLQELERMGETSAEKAIDELFKVLPLPLENWFGGLAIPLCATSTMRAIVDAGYDTLEAIRTISEKALLNIPGVGPKRAKALKGWLDANQDLIDDMLQANIGIKAKVKGALTGKSVCFTGKSKHKRAELETMAKEAGGMVKKSVSKGLTYLVLANPNSTSTKAKAARKNNTECISEDDFLQMVGRE
jgi:DNA ligase (NAD+)